MKTAKLTTLILVITLLSTSCKKGGLFCYQEDGNITTEERSVSSFSKVSLSTIGNVYVEQATEQSVIVETSSNLQGIIKTEVKGSTLDIKTKHNKCIKGTPLLNIYIKTPNVKGLTISGSGNIYCNRAIQTSEMDITISGSGNIQADSLQADNVEVDISGSGNVVLESNQTVTKEKLKISGSGNITTLNMLCTKADINISGSGTCKVNVADHMDVNISGSGDVFYLGTPTISSNISGSGDIKPY